MNSWIMASLTEVISEVEPLHMDFKNLLIIFRKVVAFFFPGWYIISCRQERNGVKKIIVDKLNEIC